MTERISCEYCDQIQLMSGRRHCPIHAEEELFPPWEQVRKTLEQNYPEMFQVGRMPKYTFKDIISGKREKY